MRGDFLNTQTMTQIVIGNSRGKSGRRKRCSTRCHVLLDFLEFLVNDTPLLAFRTLSVWATLVCVTGLGSRRLSLFFYGELVFQAEAASGPSS